MNRVQELNEKLQNNRQQVIYQYANKGNTFIPIGKSVNELEPNVYKLIMTMNGPQFEIHTINTDELLKFEDSRFNLVLNEIDNFWNLEPNFKELGFSHKRGMLLYGPPGTGKSCLLKLVMESTIESGNIVVIPMSPNGITEGVKAIKEIEKDRKVLVVIEDLDNFVRYDEQSLLQYFDGDDQQDNILVLATTNYLERLPQRMTRAGRLDRIVEIGDLPEQGRRAYLQNKLEKIGKSEFLNEFVSATKGFNFAELREMMVSIFCLKNPPNEVLEQLSKRIKGKVIKPIVSEKLNRISESIKKVDILLAKSILN